MKNKSIIFVFAMVFAAEYFTHGQTKGFSAGNDSVQLYMDKARWGDGDAFLWLARCYRDGTGVESDFLMAMQMGMMAEECLTIPNLDTLFNEVSDNNNIKVIYDANKLFGQPDSEDLLLSKAELLLERDRPEGYVFKAMVSFRQGKTDEALALCEEAIKRGSVLAVFAKEAIVNGGEDKLHPEVLLGIADRFPFAYRLLGEHYAKIPNDSAKDIASAVRYYRMADEKACLGREGAVWLLNAIETRGVAPLDSMEVKRLHSLIK